MKTREARRTRAERRNRHVNLWDREFHSWLRETHPSKLIDPAWPLSRQAMVAAQRGMVRRRLLSVRP